MMDAAYTGQQISERRKAKGLTQKALAELLHVTDKAVSKWERGINFPDLGVLEALAIALDTTPAVLLGLEEIPREAAIDSMVQLSAEQVEEAKKDICCIGWTAILTVVLLALAITLYGHDVTRTQYAYYILYSVTLGISVGARYILTKYGQIRQLEVIDLIPIGMILISILTLWLVQLASDRNPAPLLFYGLIITSSVGLQWLFYRMMVPLWARTIPMTAMLLYDLWHIVNGSISAVLILPLICCTATWLVLNIKQKHQNLT